MSASPINGLPAVDRAALPADIRKAPAADQQIYRSALGFEQTLMSEMLKSVELLGESSEEAPAAYREMVPTTLAQSVTAQGGSGLARSIYDGIKAGQ